MKSFSVIACSFGFLFLAACALDSESPTPKGAETTRTISQELRSNCPETPASRIPTARLAADPVLEVDTSAGFTLVDSVYDASGALIDADRMEMHLDSAELVKFESRQVYFPWNGTDSTGRPVDGGKSFHFYRILDETGRIVLTDSTCVVYVRGAGN